MSAITWHRFLAVCGARPCSPAMCLASILSECGNSLDSAAQGDDLLLKRLGQGDCGFEKDVSAAGPAGRINDPGPR